MSLVLDQFAERAFVGVAHALFINRLHVLRLTEVVRLGIRPNPDDGDMIVPPEVDRELKQQAIDYVIACLPQELSVALHEAKNEWLRPA
jgi:hypothetical protein